MARRLTTHVLDTARGRPAAGIPVVVSRLAPGEANVVARALTNADGRTDEPLLEGGALTAGTYELVFAVGGYFAGYPGAATPPFLDEVPVRVTLPEGEGAFHVPLLVSPWSYATYRGS